jgi:hypothetical protein
MRQRPRGCVRADYWFRRPPPSKFVAIPKMVLAVLKGHVTEGLEQFGNGRVLLLQADWSELLGPVYELQQTAVELVRRRGAALSLQSWRGHV